MTENWSKQSIVDAYNLDRRDFSREYFSGLDLREITLTRADLIGADLSGANLTWSDLDFSSWPLWCGSIGVKVDKKIAVQLMYHACALDCDDPEYREARAKVLDFANQMHRPDVKRLE